MLTHGLAPVPPSLPAIVIISAPAFATPTAIVPTPGSETKLTGLNLRLNKCHDAVEVISE